MSAPSSTSDQLRPWQFFTLCGLVCATGAVFLIRGTAPGNLILVCLGVLAAGVVGLASLGALRPLVTGETREPEMAGSSTRASVEREKNLVLRSIKELEFDHAMGKVGEADYAEMVARLRTRAVRLMEQLDASGSGYREIIERELAKRLAKAGVEHIAQSPQPPASSLQPTASSPQSGIQGSCSTCGTTNDADARFCKSCGARLLAMLLAIIALAAPAWAQLQMPDPKTMSGIPRPVTDLPSGHVSVRLIRGQLSNNIQGHPVEVHAGGKVVTTKTDENGRAEFSGIAAGTGARAVAVVDGERLESQEFPWPSDNGIRLMLVATAPASTGPAPVFQPVPGTVVLGGQTQVIIDPGDDGLQVYYVLDIQNSARAPVNPTTAFALDVPTGAQSTTVLEGAPQAVARGDRVTVTGPFPPGQTTVQVAYQMPFDSGEVSLQQTMPVSTSGLTIILKKTSALTLTSPQLAAVGDREFEGQQYIIGQGQSIPAGGVLSLTVSGLPHHSPVPRRVAIALAVLIIGGGFWAAAKRPARDAVAGRAQQLTTKREKLFGELVRLEQQKRAGQLDAARYADKRASLIGQLERVYRDLDAHGGQGAAA